MECFVLKIPGQTFMIIKQNSSYYNVYMFDLYTGRLISFKNQFNSFSDISQELKQQFQVESPHYEGPFFNLVGYISFVSIGMLIFAQVDNCCRCLNKQISQVKKFIYFEIQLLKSNEQVYNWDFARYSPVFESSFTSTFTGSNEQVQPFTNGNTSFQKLIEFQSNLKSYLDQITQYCYLSQSLDLTNAVVPNKVKPQFHANLLLSASLRRDNVNFVPFIIGSVSSMQINEVQFTLITRQNISHTGTRFNARGLNLVAAAANEYETEIVCQRKEEIYSQIYVRGSVPLVWETKAGLLENSFVIHSEDENQRLLQVYFKTILQKLEAIQVVSLLRSDSNSIGDECQINRVYERKISEFNQNLANIGEVQGKVRFNSFQWHESMKQNAKVAEELVLRQENFCKIDNLTAFDSESLANFRKDKEYIAHLLNGAQLLASIFVIQPFVPDFTSARLIKTTLVLKSVQKCAIRINCADSLDRTNLALFSIIIISCQMLLQSLSSSDSLTQLMFQRGLQFQQIREPQYVIKLMEDLLFGGLFGQIFGQFAEAFLQIGNTLSDLYTGTPAAHHEFLQNILSVKKANNSMIAIQRRINNIFSDDAKSQSAKFLSLEGVFWLISSDINSVVKYQTDQNSFAGYPSSLGKTLLALFCQVDNGELFISNKNALSSCFLAHRVIFNHFITYRDKLAAKNMAKVEMGTALGKIIQNVCEVQKAVIAHYTDFRNIQLLFTQNFDINYLINSLSGDTQFSNYRINPISNCLNQFVTKTQILIQQMSISKCQAASSFILEHGRNYFKVAAELIQDANVYNLQKFLGVLAYDFNQLLSYNVQPKYYDCIPVKFYIDQPLELHSVVFTLPQSGNCLAGPRTAIILSVDQNGHKFIVDKIQFPFLSITGSMNVSHKFHKQPFFNKSRDFNIISTLSLLIDERTLLYQSLQANDFIEIQFIYAGTNECLVPKVNIYGQQLHSFSISKNSDYSIMNETVTQLFVPHTANYECDKNYASKNFVYYLLCAWKFSTQCNTSYLRRLMFEELNLQPNESHNSFISILSVVLKYNIPFSYIQGIFKLFQTDFDQKMKKLIYVSPTSALSTYSYSSQTAVMVQQLVDQRHPTFTNFAESQKAPNLQCKSCVVLNLLHTVKCTLCQNSFCVNCMQQFLHPLLGAKDLKMLFPVCLTCSANEIQKQQVVAKLLSYASEYGYQFVDSSSKFNDFYMIQQKQLRYSSQDNYLRVKVLESYVIKGFSCLEFVKICCVKGNQDGQFKVMKFQAANGSQAQFEFDSQLEISELVFELEEPLVCKNWYLVLKLYGKQLQQTIDVVLPYPVKLSIKELQFKQRPLDSIINQDSLKFGSNITFNYVLKTQQCVAFVKLYNFKNCFPKSVILQYLQNHSQDQQERKLFGPKLKAADNLDCQQLLTQKLSLYAYSGPGEVIYQFDKLVSSQRIQVIIEDCFCDIQCFVE